MTARDELRKYVHLLADSWTPRETTDDRVEWLYGQVRAEVRAEVLAEAKTETVAWLVKKAGEQEAYDAATLASKVDRGAVRIFIGTGHYRDAMDAHRAEVLAEDGQAYPGELAMYRELVRTLRVVVRHDDDAAEVRRLLHQHAADDATARTEGKSSHSVADATPAFFQPGHTYTNAEFPEYGWKFRCDTVTTHPENGERTALGWRFFRGEWEPYAYHEDDWDVHQYVGHTDVTEGRATTAPAARCPICHRTFEDCTCTGGTL